MDLLPTEDIILKQKKDMKKKNQIVYYKEFMKNISGPALAQHNRQQLEYRNVVRSKKYFHQPIPVHIKYKKEWYVTQKDNKKHPYLRSNDGEFVISFD
mgnify:CR=1 FL=1|tara:strand:- start:147 stop:440 length:294 start_codon:yes stop_codon:yes gene_type:complete